MDQQRATVHVLPVPAGLLRRARTPRPVRVHVVAADWPARTVLRTLLEGHPGLRVTGAGAPGTALARDLRVLRPEVLVVDGRLGAGQRARLLWSAVDDVRVLTVGGDTLDPTDRAAALGAWHGRHGHLPATATAGQLAAAVVLAAAGYTLLPPPGPTTRPGRTLTARARLLWHRLLHRRTGPVGLYAVGAGPRRPN